MPIVFQQPSPMAPGITAGAGAATQYTHDLPSLVSLYESLRRNQGGGGHAGGGGEFFGGQAQPSAPPHFLQPGIGAPPNIGEDRLNQAEQIRIAKLQAGESWVDSQDSLSEAEKQEYKSMIRAGLDPLLMKQQQVKLTQMKSQEQQLQQQQALMWSMTQAHREADANGAQATFPTILGADGRRHTFYPDGKGGWKLLEAKNAASEETALAKQRAQQEAQWLKQYDTVRRQIVKENADLVKKDPDHYQLATGQEVEDEIANQLRNRGLPGTRDEFDLNANGGPLIRGFPERSVEQQAQPQAAAPVVTPQQINQRLGNFLLQGNASAEDQFADYASE